MAEQQGWLDRLWQWLGMEQESEAEEPEVTWLLLPPYDIPGMAVITALLVENQGYAAATGVHISLSYPSERFISHMEVRADDEYRMEGGGPRDSYMTLELAQLRSGGKVVIYVAGHNDQPPEVTVAVSGDETP